MWAERFKGMSTRDDTLDNLQGILDRLGPGASLCVDDRWLSACFGEGGHQGADHFAKANHCDFIPDGEGGKFIRAYSKQGRHGA